MRVLIAAVISAMALGGAAQADPVDGKAAKKMLFSPRGADLQVIEDSGLDETQRAIVKAILAQTRAQGLANYYGAVAVSPDFFTRMVVDADQAALSGLLQVTERLHSPETAANVALASCEAARESGDAACVLAARILPKRWSEQPLMMSVSATAAFKAYRKGREEKAFAISTNTVAYAAARGTGAAATALDACNKGAAKTGEPDCEVVIAD